MSGERPGPAAALVRRMGNAAVRVGTVPQPSGGSSVEEWSRVIKAQDHGGPGAVAFAIENQSNRRVLAALQRQTALLVCLSLLV